MGRDVVAAVQRMAIEHGQKKESEAAAFVQQMEAQGKLVKELWS
jgi:sulfite reductase alpha subunit-like flavoprotein